MIVRYSIRRSTSPTTSDWTTSGARVDLPQKALEALGYDQVDKVIFQVRWRDNEIIDGIPDLPPPPTSSCAVLPVPVAPVIRPCRSGIAGSRAIAAAAVRAIRSGDGIGGRCQRTAMAPSAAMVAVPDSGSV